MKVDFTVLKRQYEKHQDEYEEAALRALRSGWYIMGREMENFEREFAAMNGVKHCIAVGNGLDALRLSLTALGIGEGDEVIVQANTYIATALAVTANGAIPVFVDADAYYGIDPVAMEKAITPKTKAVMAVHLYGQMCDMEAITEIAHRHGLYVVEDCAQSHLATHKGKLAGTVGDLGAFSFYPTKTIGAFGDAGAILTNSDEWAEKLEMLRNYGSRVKYQHEMLGINSRMDEIQAAIIRVNMHHAEEGNRERSAIAQKYLTGIYNAKVRLPELRPGNTHVWYVFAIRCREREALMQYLEENGIHTLVHYPIPCHLAPCYKSLGYQKGQLPVSEQFADEEVSLPIYVGMPEDEIQYVIDTINRF